MDETTSEKSLSSREKPEYSSPMILTGSKTTRTTESDFPEALG
jgi:hypothetical protein